MDVCNQKRKALQYEESWTPRTPYNPILPKPINNATEEFSPDFFSSNGNWEVALNANGKNGTRIETCKFLGFNCTSPFALRGQPSAASTSGKSPKNEGFLAAANHQNINYTREYQCAYDLNLPPRGTTVTFSSKTTSQIAPITPEKSTTADRQVAQLQCFSIQERGNQETNKQGNEIGNTAVDSNRPQTDIELQKTVTDKSSAICTVTEENHNPDKEESGIINVVETPEQKPKKRRHRPKVITEAKPRPRKPITPKHAPNTENPTVKRKYVRKKPLSNAPTTTPAESTENPTGKRNYVQQKALNEISTPPMEATRESTNTKALEPVKKLCRRSLKFDIEGQSGDDNSKYRLNSNENFQPQAHDARGGTRSKSTVTLGQGIEVIVDTTQTGIAYDLNHSVNQMIQQYISLPEKQALSTLLPAEACLASRKRNNNSQESYANGEDQVTVHHTQQNTAELMMQTPNQLLTVNLNDSSCSTSKGSNRKLFNVIPQPSICSTNLNGILYNALPQYQAESWLQLPSNLKKRTEKTQNAITSSTFCLTTAKCPQRLDITGSQNNAIGDPPASMVSCLIPSAYGEPGSLQYNMQTSSSILAETERSTKRRSRGSTRMRDLASLTEIAREAMHLSYTDRQTTIDSNVQEVGDSKRPRACIDALVEEMRGTLATKKRTKRGLVNFTSSSINVEQSHGKIILYSQDQFSLGAPPEVICKKKTSVDEITDHLQHLDINREVGIFACMEQNALVPYGIGNEQQNALVLYKSDGTMIPFTESLVKKRRPRPKVDLDEETNKVWKLLMGNINSEGIDGTDEDKAKWWEDERNVFHGRANSFIARMHLVQGDRRFSQWKGSVVDSVVGVFLTQNVSDHLSSSAFMALAARFPLKSQSDNNPCYEGRTGSFIDKPIVCMPYPEDAIETSSQSICDQTSMTLHDSEPDEEREVICSNESSTSSTGIVSSSGIETYCESMKNRSTTENIKIIDTCDIVEKIRATNDALSSQNSAVSSQNSVDSPIAQTAERKEAFSENNSEARDVTDGYRSSLHSCNSFMELLHKVGSNKLHEIHNGIVLSDQNSMGEYNKNQTLENDFHMQNTYSEDTLKSPLVPTVPSNNFHSHVASNLRKMFQITAEETRCSNKINGRNSMKESSSFAEVSESQITEENHLTMTTQASISPTVTNPSCSKIQGDKHAILENPSKDLNIVTEAQPRVQNNEMQQTLYLPNLSEETLDTMGSSSTLNIQEKKLQTTTESDIIEHEISEVRKLDEVNAAKRKAKSRRVGKEIIDEDWDALRKDTEENGKRERTPNTMDSLDWEAVRCADVNEIADTIKERGMNNMLAERIKNFLNRLIREHGSIDLEWLRDVPPDKAKEYLLSIRGLGLKSVECVRLLTLHHLAFPVDTNVGRIAVRLGWVPLQPLPESLQLHLLELYPVLESIQKYLWPRLCKLDQRTLYELHYQMITFGKVFCTKSKPNCNACPMRGECRHFASAFASARLALPGPEEKGIVSAAKNRSHEPNPAGMVGQPLLPLPQATEQEEQNQLSKLNQQPEARHGIKSCEPIVEEPSSPEPECTQVAENDIEDTFCEDPDEIPTIKLNIEEFTQNLQSYMQNNMELQECDMSKALVALTTEAASIPMPKLKSVSRLRTEHHVYELPDSHPLLQGLDKREPDDPCSYLLAIWTPGETANSIQPLERSCNLQEYGKLCDEKTCFSCNSIREANSQIVRGTLLIPCRTAMRGSFPLNGTYFQVNEVFADHDSSLNPIDVPRSWIWNLPRRTVYFGTSIPTIFKGLTTEGIQHCFWRGFVCVRGFDQKTRAPRPLMARLHFPASKLNKTKGKDSKE